MILLALVAFPRECIVGGQFHMHRADHIPFSPHRFSSFKQRQHRYIWLVESRNNVTGGALPHLTRKLDQVHVLNRLGLEPASSCLPHFAEVVHKQQPVSIASQL